MATWTAQRAGNWSDDAANGTSPWNGGSNPASGIPAAGDAVSLGAYSVVQDSGAATIPASGTLASLTATSGQLTIDLTAGNRAINCTAFSAGTNDTGLINVSGSTSNTLTITSSGAWVTGNGTSDSCLYFNSTGNLVVTGNPTMPGTGTGTNARVIYNVTTGTMTLALGSIKGGNATNGGNYAVMNASTGNVTITMAAGASITGGDGNRCIAIYNNTTGTMAITGGNLVDSAQSPPMFGKYTWNPGTANYRLIKGPTGDIYLYPGGGRFVGDRTGGKA